MNISSKLHSQGVFSRKRTPKHLILDKPYVEKKWGLGWLSAALTLLVVSLFISSNARSAIPDSGNLNFTDGQQSIHVNTQVEATISGMFAKVEVAQDFKNNSSEWKEGIYTFPLPENSAIIHMEMQIGETRITGEIKEKKLAEKIYLQAKSEGKKSALTEQQRPNLFTQKVANIPPGEIVKITLSFLQPIEFDMGKFSWRFPMTLTPRYIPGEVILDTPIAGEAQLARPIENENISIISSFGWAAPTFQVPDAHKISPPMKSNSHETLQNPISFKIHLNSGLENLDIHSDYHDITVSDKEGKQAIQLAESKTEMDRDFELNWTTNNELPEAAIFSETFEDEHFAMIMLVPPHIRSNGSEIDRDIVFIIDTSGSMQGGSIVQAKQSLLYALDQLSPGDKFNIIEFNSTFSPLYYELKYADSKAISEAKTWVGSLNANGGTEMLPALNYALDQFSQGDRLQQAVFITDGSVGNETALFSTIHSNLQKTRLFTVGIGSAPNSFFMRKASEFGRGTFTYIRTTSEVESRMRDLFLKLDSAAVHNIQIDLDGNGEYYPSSIPDIYFGDPLLITIRLADLDRNLSINGSTGNYDWSKNFKLNRLVNTEGIGNLWARSKVDFLEDKKTMGEDPVLIREEVLGLALKHQLVTAYSSFVAVEQSISRPDFEALNSEPLANLLPHGQTRRSIPYPQTATTAEISWWLGLFAAFGMIILRLMRRDD